MTTVMIDNTPATKNEATLTITMRGDIDKITHALVHGFPREALQQLADAFASELAKRDTNDGKEPEAATE
jgi:hypothetical protein